MPTKSFEDRLARLEQVAASLKDGKIPLEEAIALFEEGSKLAKTLEKELARVERKVQVLSGEEAETGEPALRLFPELDPDEGESDR
jgi:exodeoxyribonuclease VII small subunit